MKTIADPHDRPPGLGDPALDGGRDPVAPRARAAAARRAGRTSPTRHGHTIDDVRADGFEPDVILPWPGDDDATEDPPAATQAATTLEAVGAALRQAPPDALLLVGDRLETAAAALAATLERVPIIHLHGGEQTLGAFDDALRHAITKLSHLHLVSHEEHARRVVAMGEDPASVHVVGAPGLDAAVRDDLPSRDGARRRPRPGARRRRSCS